VPERERPHYATVIREYRQLLNRYRDRERMPPGAKAEADYYLDQLRRMPAPRSASVPYQAPTRQRYGFMAHLMGRGWMDALAGAAPPGAQAPGLGG
jgi:hypothetical protein